MSEENKPNVPHAKGGFSDHVSIAIQRAPEPETSEEKEDENGSESLDS